MRDALIQPATPQQVVAFARARGIEPKEARDLLEQLRSRQIKQRRDDPYNFGYEPPIWYVVKALVRNPCWSGYERATIRRTGQTLFGHQDWTAEQFAEAMRTRLGFQHAVTKLLIMGSNRSGKTDFAMKFCVQTAMQGNKKVFSGAQTLKTQKKIQMPRYWHYMKIGRAHV